MANPNLPNDIFRFIQQEETSGLAPFSESLAQGVGGDINYLKNQLDTLQTKINSYFAAGAASVGGIFFAGYIPPNNNITPNGKPWYICFIAPEFNGSVVAPWSAVIPGQVTYFNPGFFGGLNAVISGNTLTANNWGHEWSGFGLYQT